MKPKEETRHHKAVSSAFAPMRPKINAALADRLLRQAEEARKVKAALPAVATPQAQPGRRTSASFTVELMLEIVNDLEKVSPAWGYVRAFTLGAVLNRAFEPTRTAVAARDFAQVRWLSMLAIVNRLLAQHFREPAIKIVRQYLWKVVERPESALWDGCGISFRLSRHPISAGLEQIDLNASSPQPFGQFVISGPRPSEGDVARNGS
jgi:hypothetical protein